MKSLMQFATQVLAECGDLCGGINTSRDLETITTRLKSEGESFLTISLPAFAKDLERALDDECVDPNMFAGFGFHGKLPKFLGGFLDLIFDRRNGFLLGGKFVDINRQSIPFGANARLEQIAAIQAVRQICLMFAKINRACTEDRMAAAFEQYIQVEKELRASDKQWGADEHFVLQFRSAVTASLLEFVLDH